ncbi:hypothetical protein D3C85_1484590 [compost metagenome]
MLALDEAPQHPHLQARGVYQELDGMLQVAPAPRLSRTPGQARPSLRLEADAPVWEERVASPLA